MEVHTVVPCVTVVVVTYRSAALLPDFVASLSAGLAQTNWKLIVVDNASDDETVAVARRLIPEALIIEMQHNRGYAAGINAGVAVADSDAAILVLNPDVRLGPGCAARLHAALEIPHTGIAVPRLDNGRGELIHSIRREPSLLRMVGDTLLGGKRSGRISMLGEVDSNARNYETPHVVDWAEGSTLLISRRCWDACGKWDESFFLYSEETEYALRAKGFGFTTRFVPAARATHLRGGSSTSPGSWALLSVNRVRLYGRRNGPVAQAAFYVVLLAREASRALIGRRTGRAALTELLTMRVGRQRTGPEIIARHAC
jgi:N-acetylglucosaminyl-diphospho-decaprenol L-rhamnosyltransferase